MDGKRLAKVRENIDSSVAQRARLLWERREREQRLRVTLTARLRTRDRGPSS